jgi:2-dehydro-3-deoxyphosphogluconate aldolase / (4S)-4-hydroxy-2-oxoglutarate aldolase
LIKTNTEKQIFDTKLIGIIRAEEIPDLPGVIHALLNGGMTVLEVSFNTPGATAMISQINRDFGSDLCCGAGTVLDDFSAMRAIEAGAKFVISPIYSRSMIAACRRYGIPAIPGIFTPTEAFNAFQDGASFLKVFPAGESGPGFIKAMKTVLPQLPLIAVGGVTLENADDFIRAGASAVAVGSALMNDATLRNGDFASITQKVKQFLERISNV